MYEKVNITENHLRVLSLYTRGYGKEHYIREVGTLLKISPRTAQLILADLERKGTLISNERGKIRAFSLNKANPIAKAYAILAEDYKKALFLSKHPEIKQLLNELESIDYKNILAVFGSYAKGTQKEGSDLDILAIGEKSFTKIREMIKVLEEKHTFKINVRTASIKTFDKRDFLIREVLESHICIQNADGLVRLAW